MTSFPKLPATEHTFDFDVVGSVTGRRYFGTFTFTKPTLGMRAEIAKTTARLGGEVALLLDENQRSTNYTIAWLQNTLTKYPQWWADEKYGLNLYDDNVIKELVVITAGFEKQWDSNLQTQAVAASDEVRNEQHK